MSPVFNFPTYLKLDGSNANQTIDIGASVSGKLKDLYQDLIDEDISS